jgi:hypothetical protein
VAFPAHFRFTPDNDIRRMERHVCFVPKADIVPQQMLARL